jgi:DNA repair protein RadC
VRIPSAQCKLTATKWFGKHIGVENTALLAYHSCMSERFHPPEYIQRTFAFDEEPLNEEMQKLHRLHESLAPYVDTESLRHLVLLQRDLHEALRSDNPPAEVLALIDTLSALLRPAPREQIRSPRDVVALLMVEMGHLDQEELRTILLDTRNQIQDIVAVYRGSLNASMIRVVEVYKAAIKRNSAAIIVAHNHPSGDPTPSPVIWRM